MLEKTKVSFIFAFISKIPSFLTMLPFLELALNTITFSIFATLHFTCPFNKTLVLDCENPNCININKKIEQKSFIYKGINLCEFNNLFFIYLEFVVFFRQLNNSEMNCCFVVIVNKIYKIFIFNNIILKSFDIIFVDF